MKRKRGVVGWLPKMLINESEDIMREEGIQNRAEALMKLTSYAQVGRELRRLTNLNTNWSKKKPPKKYTKNDLDNEFW